MEDCKCGRIPPCYSGRVFNIYEETKKVRDEWGKTRERFGAMIDNLRAKLMEGGFFDDTYHKVYGVNEQLCDLGKRLSDPLDPPSEEAMKRASDTLESHLKTMRELNRKSKLPIEVTEEHIKIINRFMEEKKTKKMTKAEAFEYLKCKKVYVGGNSAAIQEKLFEAGFEWGENKRNISNLEQPFLILSEGGGIFYGNNMCHYLERSHEEISADDILSIEIVEDEPLDKWDEFARCVAKVQEKIEEDEVCIITKGNFLTMTK